MKRFVLISLLFLITSLLFSEPIYKEFLIDGEKIYKWVNKTFVNEYDSNGNVIHRISSSVLFGSKSITFESWYEYDSNGNEIHEISSNGEEYLYEYDSKGNKIHGKRSGVFEYWCEYDSNGNEIHRKRSDGSEYWYEYEYYPDKKIKNSTKYESI